MYNDMQDKEKKTGEVKPHNLFKQHETNVRTLIERVKAGDEVARNDFCTYYSPDVRQAIKRSLSARKMPLDHIDDIEQNVWQTVYEKMDQFEWRTEEELKHWLGSIALRHLFTLRRKEAKQNISLDELSEKEDAHTRFHYRKQLYTESAEAEYQRREIRQQLMVVLDRAMRELSARDREIVMRRYINKEKPADIADHFGLKVTNVYQILQRTKKSIQSYLGGTGLFTPEGDNNE